MCVLYVSFGSKVSPITFGFLAMRSAVLFIFRSRLLLYSAGFGVSRVQVIWPGFSVMKKDIFGSPCKSSLPCTSCSLNVCVPSVHFLPQPQAFQLLSFAMIRSVVKSVKVPVVEVTELTPVPP